MHALYHRCISPVSLFRSGFPKQFLPHGLQPLMNAGGLERFPKRHPVGRFALPAKTFPFTMICAILDAETRVPIDI